MLICTKQYTLICNYNVCRLGQAPLVGGVSSLTIRTKNFTLYQILEACETSLSPLKIHSLVCKESNWYTLSWLAYVYSWQSFTSQPCLHKMCVYAWSLCWTLLCQSKLKWKCIVSRQVLYAIHMFSILEIIDGGGLKQWLTHCKLRSCKRQLTINHKIN